MKREKIDVLQDQILHPIHNAAENHDWKAVVGFWDSAKWGLLSGTTFFMAGPIAQDPFATRSDQVISIIGYNADIYECGDDIMQAAAKLNFPLAGKPHPLITYMLAANSQELAPDQRFIVPSRWQFGAAPQNPLPSLLELGAHMDRVLDNGRENITALYGHSNTDRLFAFAFGKAFEPDYDIVQEVTGMEYAAHSCGHLAWDLPDNEETAQSMKDVNFRAAEEWKADIAATALVAEAHDRKKAQQLLAAQIIMRLAQDLNNPSTAIEAEAHRKVAQQMVDAIAKGRGNVKSKSIKIDWNGVTGEILDARLKLARRMVDVNGFAPLLEKLRGGR